MNSEAEHRHFRPRTGRVGELGLVVAVFAALVLLADPRGDIPLNDDWNFALATWHFADTGEFRFSRFTAMSLRLQVLWGALWTLLLGKSFEVLRASTLVLSLGSLLLLNRLLARIGVSSVPRLLATFALLVHPVFFWSSLTYMTQVPYLFCSIAAFYAYVRALTESDRRWMLAGGLAVIASFSIRQTGLANAIPPLILILFERERLTPRWRSFAAIAVLPFLAFMVLFLGTDWLQGYPGQIEEHFALFQGPLRELPLGLAELVFRETIMNFQYGFLFVLPLLIALPSRMRMDRRAAAIFLLSLVPIMLACSWMVFTRNPMPYRTGGQVFMNFGLGPPTLRDTWLFGYPYPFHLPEWAAATLTYASGAGALWLLFVLAGSLRGPAPGTAGVVIRLSALQAIAGTVVLYASSIYFDRYALDSLWSLIVLAAVAGNWSRRAMRASAVLLVLWGFFSVFATQEYLRWNRARWQAFAFLQEQGIPLRSMDGGYEINQYLQGGFDGSRRLRLAGMSVIDDEYILAFQPVRGYRVIRSFPFRGFLGLRRGFVHAEKREKGFGKFFDREAGSVRRPR